ncbi:hypothetical protein ABZP36_015551 [Zizania latifolia]
MSLTVVHGGCGGRGWLPPRDWYGPNVTLPLMVLAKPRNHYKMPGIRGTAAANQSSPPLPLAAAVCVLCWLLLRQLWWTPPTSPISSYPVFSSASPPAACLLAFSSAHPFLATLHSSVRLLDSAKILSFSLPFYSSCPCAFLSYLLLLLVLLVAEVVPATAAVPIWLSWR